MTIAMAYCKPASTCAQALSAALMVVAATCVAEARSEPPTFGPQNIAEGRSKSLCESSPDRVFVKTRYGTECVAYMSTGAGMDARRAVVFIDGDVPQEKFVEFSDPAKMASRLATKRAWLERLAKVFNVRFVAIARLGLDGSSGDHGERHKPKELFAMAAAIDLIKERYSIGEIVLVGQSRGSSISAGLLTMGRTDVRCAVLGSGAFETTKLRYDALKEKGLNVTMAQVATHVRDPSKFIPSIHADPNRRVFFLGDRADTRTPFPQQERFARSVAAAGHHAALIEIRAQDDLRHGATGYAVQAAGMCARDSSDEKIRQSLEGMKARVEARIAGGAPAPAAPAASQAVQPKLVPTPVPVAAPATGASKPAVAGPVSAPTAPAPARVVQAAPRTGSGPVGVLATMPIGHGLGFSTARLGLN